MKTGKKINNEKINKFYTDNFTNEKIYSLLIDNILNGNKDLQGHIIYKKKIWKTSKLGKRYSQWYYKELYFTDYYCVVGFLNVPMDRDNYSLCYTSGIRYNINDIYKNEIKDINNIVSIKVYIGNILYRI